MHNIRDIEDYGPRWQCMVILFAALNQVRGGMTKSDAINHIRDNRWFDIHPEDRIPYPSQRHTSKEPRWMTAIAWARKDAVDRGLMHKGSRNDWDLTREGLNTFALITKFCREHELDVRRCYLWSVDFKRRLDSSYDASASDARRPKTLYDDWLPRKVHEIFLNL